MGDEAARVEQAVETVLAQGLRTADLMGPAGGTPISTAEMGDAVVAALDAGFPVNARGGHRGSCLLHWTACYGHVPILRRLLIQRCFRRLTAC